MSKINRYAKKFGNFLRKCQSRFLNDVIEENEGRQKNRIFILGPQLGGTLGSIWARFGLDLDRFGLD